MKNLSASTFRENNIFVIEKHAESMGYLFNSSKNTSIALIIFAILTTLQ